MDIHNHDILRAEARAVGCELGLIVGAEAIVRSGDQTLSALVIASHGKTGDAPELTKLRDYLKADARWDAYVACRKAETQRQRNEKFRTLSDSMLLDLLESAVTSDTGDGFLLSVPRDKWNAWKSAKAAIRLELPYEVK